MRGRRETRQLDLFAVATAVDRRSLMGMAPIRRDLLAQMETLLVEVLMPEVTPAEPTEVSHE